MLILYLSWTSKKVHTHSPQLSFFVFGGFDAHPNRESLKSGNFSGLPGMDSETFRTFLPWTKPGARNQTWGGCFLMSELVFFFRWFFSPSQVLSPHFFGCLLFDKGVITIQKKVNKSTKKKSFPTALTSQHWTQPLVEGLYDLDPTVGWHWVQHLSLTECKKACEARFFVVKIRLHQVPIGFLHFSCKIEVCTRSLCVVKR